MSHRHALAFVAFVLVAGTLQAQRAEPVDCPTVYDVRGTRLGLAWSGSLSVCVPCSNHQLDNQSVARVAMAASGEVFVVTVLRDHLMGTLRSTNRLAWFDSPDCTGNAYSDAITQEDDMTGTYFGDENRGPFLPSIVIGPRDAVYLLDGSVPLAPVPGGVRSLAYYADDDARGEYCVNTTAPPPQPLRRLRKVAELWPDYQAPFHLESGPCPRPGRR